MARGLATAAALVALALAALPAPRAGAEVAQAGGVRLRLDAELVPRELPRERPVPVAIRVSGSISSVDGGPPPPARRLVIELNRAGRLHDRGLPRCRAAALQSTTTERALELCGPARVGSGGFDAELPLSTATVPLSGRILAFLGGGPGRPQLILHLHAAAPVRATFVLPMRIERRPRGRFGTVLRTRIPRLAAGLGTITAVRLRVGRTWRIEGRRRALLSARCAAPPGFGGGLFPLARARFGFGPGREVGATLMRSCRVRQATQGPSRAGSGSGAAGSSQRGSPGRHPFASGTSSPSSSAYSGIGRSAAASAPNPNSSSGARQAQASARPRTRRR